MSEKDKSGPAFPDDIPGTASGTYIHFPGMTLRQYAAIHAMQGILSGKYGEVKDQLSDKGYKNAVARIAVEFSDFLLEELSK